MFSRLALVVALALLAPAEARALYEDEPSADLPPPRYRLELIGPLLGAGGFHAPTSGIDRQIYALSLEVRFADRSGNGFLARGVGGTTILSGGGTAVELAYLRRFRLVGNDRSGLGLDVSAGPTLAVIVHGNEAVPSGNAFGSHVGMSLDVRLWGMTISLAAQYRALMPWRGPPDGSAWGLEHAWTIMAGAGLAFYEVEHSSSRHEPR